MWANVHRKMFQVDQELEDLETEHKAASDLFEKQKEEAVATMKKSEDLKSLRLAKSQTACKLAMPQSTFLKWKRRHPQKSGIILRWIFWLVAVKHCKSAQVWSGKLTHDFSRINQLISWSVRNVLRKSLSKLRDKTAYKIAILKAKTTEKSEL